MLQYTKEEVADLRKAAAKIAYWVQENAPASYDEFNLAESPHVLICRLGHLVIDDKALIYLEDADDTEVLKRNMLAARVYLAPELMLYLVENWRRIKELLKANWESQKKFETYEHRHLRSILRNFEV